MSIKVGGYGASAVGAECSYRVGCDMVSIKVGRLCLQRRVAGWNGELW